MNRENAQQLAGELLLAHIQIDPDPQDNIMDPVGFRAHLVEQPGDFLAIQQNVVRPLDVRFKSAAFCNRPAHGNCRQKG